MFMLNTFEKHKKITQFLIDCQKNSVFLIERTILMSFYYFIKKIKDILFYFTWNSVHMK